MNTGQRSPRWAVVLGAVAALATGCGGGEPSSAPASEPSLAPAGEPSSASGCPSGEYPAAGAVNASDGTVKWLVCSPDEANRLVIGASDDIVLIEESRPEASGAPSRLTIAFDAADGSERWRRSTADTPIPPGPFDGQGIVVLATDDQGALALVGVDAVTGQETWRVESSEAPLAHSATVAVVGDVANPGTASRFRGIDRVTGDELWVSDTPLSDESGVCCASQAAVLGEVVAVPTGATVTAIDMRTGATLWQAPQLDDPEAADGLFVGVHGLQGPSTSRAIAAIDATSGEERWTAPGGSSYGGFLAVGDGVIAVKVYRSNDPPGLVAYDLSSGDERWSVTPTTAAEPQMIRETSLVLLWEGELAVRSTTDGAIIWSATEPFGTTLMNNVGSNTDSVFVAINSLPWTD